MRRYLQETLFLSVPQSGCVWWPPSRRISTADAHDGEAGGQRPSMRDARLSDAAMACARRPVRAEKWAPHSARAQLLLPWLPHLRTVSSRASLTEFP
ncbi:hypothetical protein MRX96_026988 [Rhipicephalus microplus]